MGKSFLLKEDYEEPCCPLNMKRDVTPIPTRRVMDKLDEYLNRNDYPAAERHLRYWLTEADVGNDMRGKLTILNEQIGLYRKTGKEQECMEAIESALSLVDTLGMENTITLGTTLINAATGYSAFGKTEKALPLYQKAQTVYELVLKPNDGRLGGLYNNMALALMELGDYRRAEALYGKALEIMAEQEHGEAEMAITYLNLADLITAEFGAAANKERIDAYLAEAEKLLEAENLPRDGYYAFVCDKCAPIFGYYGYSTIEQKLKQRAREIYERS